MAITCGIDVGSAAVKIVILSDEGKNEENIIYKECRKIRSGDPKIVVRDIFSMAISETGVKKNEIKYIASTGEGYFVEFKTGHFFGMTTHARGAKYLAGDTRTVIDAGALHHRVISIDGRSKVLDYKMTGQCASCSGSFIENISRYLGIGVEDTGDIAIKSTNPKPISGVCAVLAETDVINMVSQGIVLPDIFMGVFNLMADRLVKMLARPNAQSPVMLTGGLATNTGFIKALKKNSDQADLNLKINSCEDSIYAGAIGAALLGEMRLSKIAAS